MMTLGELYKDTLATEAEMAEAKKIVDALTACMNRALGTP
jgi:hypothetical protein